MKIGLIRTGTRIVNNPSATVYSHTATSIASVLLDGGAQTVHVFTDPYEGDSKFVFRNILKDCDTSGLDVLIVVNGFVIFDPSVTLGIGGNDISSIEAQMNTYRLINEFKGPVVYMLCDPEAIMKKDPFPGFSIKRDDINVVSQPFNLNVLEPRWARASGGIPAKFIHFPLEKFPMNFERPIINLDPVTDLSYGGQPRFGKRARRLFEWYLNAPDDIDVTLYGSVTKTSFKGFNVTRMPKLERGVSIAKNLAKMNEAVCHMVVSDYEYEALELVSQRTYEAIAARTVAFIDHRMDKSRRVFKPGTAMNEFSYIHTRDELFSKIRELKTNPAFRLKVLEEQEAAIQFDRVQYGKDLITTIKGIT